MTDITVGSRVRRRKQQSRNIKIGIVERIDTSPRGAPRAHVRWLNGTLRYNGNSQTRSKIQIADLLLNDPPTCGYCGGRPSSLVPCPVCDC